MYYQNPAAYLPIVENVICYAAQSKSDSAF
jgi:hypothetical protein